MKMVAGSLAVLVLVLGFGFYATAEDEKKEEVTIQGEVVDMACWLEEGKMGPDHAKCAASCVKGGTPAGIVTPDGTVYLVVPHGAEGKHALSHVGKRVEIKGVIHERGGIKGIISSSCKAMEEPKKDPKPEGSGR
jgi:hypothetical protein